MRLRFGRSDRFDADGDTFRSGNADAHPVGDRHPDRCRQRHRNHSRDAGSDRVRIGVELADHSAGQRDGYHEPDRGGDANEHAPRDVNGDRSPTQHCLGDSVHDTACDADRPAADAVRHVVPGAISHAEHIGDSDRYSPCHFDCDRGAYWHRIRDRDAGSFTECGVDATSRNVDIQPRGDTNRHTRCHFDLYRDVRHADSIADCHFVGDGHGHSSRNPERLRDTVDNRRRDADSDLVPDIDRGASHRDAVATGISKQFTDAVADADGNGALVTSTHDNAAIVADLFSHRHRHDDDHDDADADRVTLIDTHHDADARADVLCDRHAHADKKRHADCFTALDVDVHTVVLTDRYTDANSCADLLSHRHPHGNGDHDTDALAVIDANCVIDIHRDADSHADVLCDRYSHADSSRNAGCDTHVHTAAHANSDAHP